MCRTARWSGPGTPGLPAAATIPMNRNSDAPASTNTLCAAGTQNGNPEATATAP